jgi:hypothetical protein
MPLLVCFIIAAVVETAWRRAWGEGKDRLKGAVEKYRQRVAPGAQNSTAGRRVATAARGVERVGGALLKFAGALLVACAAIAGALVRGGIEGASKGAERYRQNRAEKGAEPHPFANSDAFRRTCPVCEGDLIRGGPGQAPWVHPDGSTCTAAAPSDPVPDAIPDPPKEEPAVKSVDKSVDIPSDDEVPGDTTTTGGDEMGATTTDSGVDITHEQVKATVADSADAVTSLAGTLDIMNAALEQVGMDPETKGAVAAAYEALAHAEAAVKAIDDALVAGGHDEIAEVTAGRTVADQGYYGAERG